MHQTLSILFSIFLAFALFSFSFDDHQTEQSPATLNTQTLFQPFIARVKSLTIASEAYQQQQITQDSLKRALLATRVAYKRVAFLLTYCYPSYTESHFNGAPLFHAEKYSTHSIVNPPEGLQVLDEMIFAADAPEQKAQIAILCRTLENKTFEVETAFINRDFPIEQVIEACRMELIRLFTMGLTGFDTPGSLNAIPEALSALQSMQGFLDAQEVRSPKLWKKTIRPLFEEASIYLTQHQDFDQFDRLFFLKAYLNPIYAQLGIWQDKLGLQPVSLFPSGRNAHSNNLFNPDFLNPYFYTELKAEEDGPVLRALGKALFNDERLSKTNDMSCATCHQEKRAFSDGQPKSASNILGKTVLRNSPTLLNAVFADRYFYDLRAFTLEQQSEHVIHDKAEFNTDYEAILELLNSNEPYRQQFDAVFGTTTIDREMFTKALASYVLSLQSFNSPFDQYVRGEQQAIADDVKRGFNLFMGKAACGTCHFPPTFSGLMPPYFAKNESEILGVLDSPYRLKKQVDTDQGRMDNGLHYEKVWIYEKSFKTPTVRNVEKTAPYFHNGAYPTLELVVNFYNHGGGAGLGLTVNNQTLAADPLNLTSEEKASLVAFMKSLTDNDL